MKKAIRLLLITFILLTLSACTPKKSTIVKTYEVTTEEVDFSNDELITLVEYHEMSDGTWKAGEHTYKYRLEISGRMPNAVKDTTYVYLSNIEDISFQKAMMAGGLSSNTEDYFSFEEAVLVELH